VTSKRRPRSPTGHQCGPACSPRAHALAPRIGPGSSEPGFATWEEGKAAYEHHRGEIGRVRYHPGQRHDWWWTFDDQAAEWREHPERFNLPTDAARYADPMARKFHAPQLARLRFLAASGLLRDDEITAILVRGGHEAAIVREGPRPRHGGAA
jgi:hypothetical protein